MELSLQQIDSKQLLDHKMPRYEDLPSFGIYVDQLISLVNESIDIFYMPEEKLLTSSMVNNYVKHDVVPKPEKKKYSRDHVAYLMVICILKKVFNIAEISELIKMQPKAYSAEQCYNFFMDSLETSIAEAFRESYEYPNQSSAKSKASKEDILLVQQALRSFASKLFVQKQMAWSNKMECPVDKKHKKEKNVSKD